MCVYVGPTPSRWQLMLQEYLGCRKGRKGKSSPSAHPPLEVAVHFLPLPMKMKGAVGLVSLTELAEPPPSLCGEKPVAWEPELPPSRLARRLWATHSPLS